MGIHVAPLGHIIQIQLVFGLTPALTPPYCVLIGKARNTSKNFDSFPFDWPEARTHDPPHLRRARQRLYHRGGLNSKCNKANSFNNLYSEVSYNLQKFIKGLLLKL